VCLPLLGTWKSGVKGEEWQPGVSTILQVLISIQAMVLCDNPEYNEPEFEMYYGQGNASGPSKFTQAVRSLTIGYGITQWAENPPTLWKEIVENHLRKTGDKILSTAEQWARESHQSSRRPHDASLLVMRDMRGTYGATGVDTTQCLPQLQKALKNYGATHVIQDMEDMIRREQVGSGEAGYGTQVPPYGRGNRFHGAGGMGDYGGHGFGFGRGF
jgi:baculoviral IAP repeat-containing protein 6